MLKDEQGRPFIVVREYVTDCLERIRYLAYGANGFVLYSQGKKKRQHGTEAIKSHIVAAKTVANIVKTSLV